jgi:glycine dehydrogenase subunit 2
VLNSAYLAARVRELMPLGFETPSLHEAVFSDRELEKTTGLKTLDVAKRLIDYGFHPPTVYFPLVVRGALMIEPTETETRQTLDAFVDALASILEEAAREPELLRGAPHLPRVGRLDEALAARKPRLRWTSEPDAG